MLAAAVPFVAGAQSIAFGVNGAAVDAHHSLMGNALTGVGAHIEWHPLAPLSWRLRFQAASGESERFGIPCGGFILPEECPVEPIRDDSRMAMTTFGIARRIGRPAALYAAVTADAGLAYVRANSRGQSSGRELNASKVMLNGWIGLQGSWLVPRTPVALRVSADVGRVTANQMTKVVDGYEPFDDGFGVRRLSIGFLVMH